MKIGIFDSGLGGLMVARAIRKMMPEYDYVYLGDTKRVPYGNRSPETVFEFAREGIDFLFRRENCALVVVACNTVSARALRKLQKEYSPSQKHTLRHSRSVLEGQVFSGRSEDSFEYTSASAGFPFGKILGVLIPAAEACAGYERIGVLGTAGTISSNAFPVEIKKIKKRVSEGSPRSLAKNAEVFQNPAPMLVPLAEEGEKVLAEQFIKKYLKPLLRWKIEALVLGCTHYPFFKKQIRKIAGSGVKVISQDEIVPKKLKDYLARHPEIEKKLSKNSKAKILVTDITKNVAKLSSQWFGKGAKPKLVDI